MSGSNNAALEEVLIAAAYLEGESSSFRGVNRGSAGDDVREGEGHHVQQHGAWSAGWHATGGYGPSPPAGHHSSRLREVSYGSDAGSVNAARPRSPGGHSNSSQRSHRSCGSGSPKRGALRRSRSSGSGSSSSSSSGDDEDAEGHKWRERDQRSPTARLRRPAEHRSSLEQQAVEHSAETAHHRVSQEGHGISRRSSAASEPDVGLRLASRAGSATSQHSNHSHRSGRSHHSNVSFQEDVKDDAQDDAKEAAPAERQVRLGEVDELLVEAVADPSFRRRPIRAQRKTSSFRLPARYSIAGGGAPRRRDSVLSRGSLPLPTIHDDEDGGGGNIETAPPPPRGRARFRESIMALVLPVGRRRTTVSFSKSGDGAAPEGSVASKSEFDFDADLDEAQPRRFYKRPSFWVSALPTAFSCFALAAALALQLTPRFHFTTMVQVAAIAGQPAHGYQSTESFRFLVRWCFFAAGLTPAYLVAWYLMHVLVVLVEKGGLFARQRVVYFVIGMRVAVERLLRAAFMLALFAALFGSAHWTMHATKKCHITVLRLLGCQVLFMTGNFLKTLIAKMLSSRFHKAAHFEKLQDALRKEYLLTQLAAPRHHPGGSDFSPEDGDFFAHPQKSIASFMMKGRLKSMLTGSGNRAAAAAIAVAANPVAVETSAAGGQKRSPPAAADAPPPQFQQPLSLAQQPPPPPMSRPPAAASASAFQASFLPGRPSAASAASTSAASAPPTAQVAAADPVSSEADPVFGGGGAAAVSAFAGAAAARHATAVAANASSLQAAHAAPPNLASLPPHVLRDFSRACSAASASAVPLLGGYAAEPTLRAARAALLPLEDCDDPFAQHGRATSSIDPDAPLSPPRLSAARPPPALKQAASRAGSPRSARSHRSARSAPSRLHSQPGTPMSQAELKDVQAEVFSALRSAPEGDELQLLSKLHKAEKHIRNNALRLNLAERLASADSASSEISSEAEAKKLAFYLYHNIKTTHPEGITRSHKHHIVLEDVEAFLPSNVAGEAFEMLDVGQRGKVSQHDVQDAVCGIVEGRANLAATLKDTRTVVGKLERFMGVVIQAVFLFLYLLIWQVNLRNAWLQFSSCVVAGAVVFANSIRTIYESVVFLFVVHPFDVGDGIFIGALPDYYVVEEIALLNTTLTRPDGARLLYPNIVMASMGVINLARSGNHSENFAVVVDGSTPQNIFDTLRDKLREFVEANPKEFTGSHSVSCKDCPAPLKMTISVWWENSFNGMDRGRVFTLRSDIMRMVISTLEQERVSYSLPSSKHQGGLTTATEYMAAGAGMQHNPKPPGARVDPTQQDGTNAAIMGNQMLDVIRML